MKYILKPPKGSFFIPEKYEDKEEAEKRLAILNNRVKFWSGKIIQTDNLWTLDEVDVSNS